LFKIRVPSGKHFTVRVAQEEKVEYLFGFLESREEDLGL